MIKDIHVEKVISISLKFPSTLIVHRAGSLTHILLKLNEVAVTVMKHGAAVGERP